MAICWFEIPVHSGLNGRTIDFARRGLSLRLEEALVVGDLCDLGKDLPL